MISNLCSGSSAAKSSVAQCLPEAEIIHISSHLMVDSSGSPGILLTPNASSDSALLLNSEAPQSAKEGVSADFAVEGADADESQIKDQSADRSAQTESMLRSRAVLTAEEIAAMRLSASLVILSFGHSCLANTHSADKELENQRCLATIVDAFVAAGAKSVVVSMYPR